MSAADARREAYRKICERKGILEDTNYSGHEDAVEHLADPATIHRYCALTRHEDFYYANPGFDTLEAAQAWSTLYLEDDIYTETPVRIYDLDSTKTWTPVFKCDWKEHP